MLWKAPIDHDAFLCQARHAVENLFAKRKHTRNYEAMVAIACLVIRPRL